MTLPLSVVMISLNEAHHLPAVLRNLDGFAGKVFLLDSYSSDDTVDIALAHGVHVVQRRFRDFGDQWNYAVRELPIETPWVMKLDPDERITDDLKAAIREALAADRHDGFGFRRRLWLMGKPLPAQNHVVRIWRHGKCRFSDVIVNEHPIVDGDVQDLPGELEHHDSPNLHHWYEKQNRYTTAEAVAQFQRHALAEAPRLFGNRLQRRMWLKRNFWRMPGRFFLLHLYHLFGTGAWRAGRVGLIWARLRTELYRGQEFKLFEMQLAGRPLPALPGGTGPAHPAVEQAPDPEVDVDPAPLPDTAPLPDGGLAAEHAASPQADPGSVAHHEALAADWDARYASGGFRRRAEFIRTRVLDRLSISGAWLDAGCGSGFFSRMLAEAGAQVRGVDAATGMVDAARSLAASHAASNRLCFARIDTVEALPDADTAFDGVVSLSVLEYLPDPATALAEFARVLKPGGTILVSLPNTHSPVRRLAKWKNRLKPMARPEGLAYLDHSRFELSRRQIAPFFTRHGLEVTDVAGFDPVLPGGLGTYAPSLFFVTATKR